MLFFRSEETLRSWCEANGHPLRPRVTMVQLWELATTWYASRLRADARRPKPAEMRTIFAAIGLEGDFWDPTSDRFGA